jgi:hypothetical protein
MTAVLQLDVVPVLVVEAATYSCIKDRTSHGTCSVYRVWSRCAGESSAGPWALGEQGEVGDSLGTPHPREYMAT